MGQVTRALSTVGRLPGGDILNALVGGVIDRALGLSTLRGLYEASRPFESCFAERALDVLRVRLEVTGAQASIPRAGGLLVVANHPSGALDGLALLALLGRLRADAKVLGNHLLATIPELRPALIAVDTFGGAKASVLNAAGLRSALQWLRRGGCLIAFPAGEVAHRVDGSIALDGAWHPHVATLAVESGAVVLPMFISGSNGRMFRLAGHLHPLLRTALLPRELLARRGDRILVTVGKLVEAGSLSRIPAPDRAAYLKTRAYLLASSLTRYQHEHADNAVRESAVEVAMPLDAARLRHEVIALPPDRLLVEGDGLQVYCAKANELPSVLREIGRLREKTFRAAGEGTGQARDLDRFDAYYWHSFAWDPLHSRIVGGYRVGVTTEILPVHGPAGLYTSTLFRYGNRLLDEIGPAIELGRSFVCEEVQRQYAPLLMLWRGIGAFIVRRPECRHVFGAVSISNRYDTLSRQLLVKFLSSVAQHPRAARLVEPLRPLQRSPRHSHVLDAAAVSSLEAVSSLLRSIEHDEKSVPVLLRQYLNLNARLIAFSVDPEFGEALDGLMLADLTRIPRSMPSRLMGAEAADEFLAYHRGRASARPYRNSRLRWVRAGRADAEGRSCRLHNHRQAPPPVDADRSGEPNLNPWCRSWRTRYSDNHRLTSWLD